MKGSVNGVAVRAARVSVRGTRISSTAVAPGQHHCPARRCPSRFGALRPWYDGLSARRENGAEGAESPSRRRLAVTEIFRSLVS